jgi:hypothetical protein
MNALAQIKHLTLPRANLDAGAYMPLYVPGLNVWASLMIMPDAAGRCDLVHNSLKFLHSPTIQGKDCCSPQERFRAGARSVGHRAGKALAGAPLALASA